jgi:hypothetical protein
MMANIIYLVQSYPNSDEKQRISLLTAFANAADMSEAKKAKLIDTLKGCNDANIWSVTLENYCVSSHGLYFTDRLIYHIERNRVSLDRQGRKEKFGAYSKMGTTVHMGQFGSLAANNPNVEVGADGQPKRSLIDKILHPRG